MTNGNFMDQLTYTMGKGCLNQNYVDKYPLVWDVPLFLMLVLWVCLRLNPNNILLLSQQAVILIY